MNPNIIKTYLSPIANYRKRSHQCFRIFAALLFMFAILNGLASSQTGKTAVTVDGLLAQMTLEEKVGQIFMPDFRKWNNRNVTQLNPEIIHMIQNYHLGGVVLFQGNIVDIEQTVKFVDGLQNAADLPLLIGIDQEGGIVNRLPYATVMPGNMALGAAASPELTYQAARIIGEELRALGINVNFAPVLDVNNNPDNPVIGVRSFGSDPDFVAQMGAAYIKGLHSAGIAATAKHFPGHGDTAIDSHLDLPSVPYNIERLRQIELKPFQEAMRQGVDMIMTAHVTFPAIDNTTVISQKDGQKINLPASLSPKVLTGLIREEMGYQGVIVTDALWQMKAINDNFSADTAALMAFKAGADLLLMPADLDKAYKAILREVNAGSISQERLDESVRRILTLKVRRGIIAVPDVNDEPVRIEMAQKIIGSQKHRLLEQSISERAVTLLRNEGDILPFQLQEGQRVLLLAPWQDRMDFMQSALQQIVAAKKINVNVKGIVYEKQNNLDDAAKRAIEEADYIVLATYSFDKATRTPGGYWGANYALAAVTYANISNKPLAAMAIRNPYDISFLPDVRAFVAVYGKADGPNIPAGIHVIFGQAKPEGKLPVQILHNIQEAQPF
jgi:beta-N-acetylhexosaminidase